MQIKESSSGTPAPLDRMDTQTIIRRFASPRRGLLELLANATLVAGGLAAIGACGGDSQRARPAPRYVLGSGGTPFITTAEAMFRPSPGIEKEPFGVVETRLVALLLQMEGFYRQHPSIKALQTPGSRTFGMNGYAFPVDSRVRYFHKNEYRSVMGEDSVLPPDLARGRWHEANYHLGFLQVVIDPNKPNSELLYGFRSLTDKRTFSLKPGENLQIRKASAREVYSVLSMLFSPDGKPAKGPGVKLNELGTNPLVFNRPDLDPDFRRPPFLISMQDFQF